MDNKKIKQQIIDAYQFRHACKIFDADKKIPEADFSFIMQTAHLSPSSFGFEPWSFIVLQDKHIRKKLLSVTWGAQRQLPTASHYVIILAKKNTFMKHGSDYVYHMMKDIQKLPSDLIEDKSERYKIFQVSDFEIEDDKSMFDWACKQCYIALGNMMSSAAMIGIDSCPIEGFSKKEVESILTEHCALDTSKYGVACMVAFGYRARVPREKTRQDISDIVKTI